MSLRKLSREISNLRRQIQSSRPNITDDDLKVHTVPSKGDSGSVLLQKLQLFQELSGQNSYGYFWTDKLLDSYVGRKFPAVKEFVLLNELYGIGNLHRSVDKDFKRIESAMSRSGGDANKAGRILLTALKSIKKPRKLFTRATALYYYSQQLAAKDKESAKVLFDVADDYYQKLEKMAYQANERLIQRRDLHRQGLPYGHIKIGDEKMPINKVSGDYDECGFEHKWHIGEWENEVNSSLKKIRIYMEKQGFEITDLTGADGDERFDYATEQKHAYGAQVGFVALTESDPFGIPVLLDYESYITIGRNEDYGYMEGCADPVIKFFRATDMDAEGYPKLAKIKFKEGEEKKFCDLLIKAYRKRESGKRAAKKGQELLDIKTSTEMEELLESLSYKEMMKLTISGTPLDKYIDKLEGETEDLENDILDMEPSYEDSHLCDMYISAYHYSPKKKEFLVEVITDECTGGGEYYDNSYGRGEYFESSPEKSLGETRTFGVFFSQKLKKLSIEEDPNLRGFVLLTEV